VTLHSKEVIWVSLNVWPCLYLMGSVPFVFTLAAVAVLFSSEAV
jgi:hypothetical protein